MIIDNMANRAFEEKTFDENDYSLEFNPGNDGPSDNSHYDVVKWRKREKTGILNKLLNTIGFTHTCEFVAKYYPEYRGRGSNGVIYTEDPTIAKTFDELGFEVHLG